MLAGRRSGDGCTHRGCADCRRWPVEPTDEPTDERLRFVGRIESNAMLERLAAAHSTRPVGRSPKEGYEKIVELGEYRAESWRHAQRLVLVLVDRAVPKTGPLDSFADRFYFVVGWKEEELDSPLKRSIDIQCASVR